MPSLPDAQLLNLQVIVYGIITSGGSNTKNTVTVFNYRRNAVALPQSKSAFNAIFQSSVVVPMAAALNNRWTQQHNTVRFVDDALDAPTLFTGAAVGGVAGDGLATTLGIYLSLQTSLRGKSYRGGKWFGPLSEADVTAPDDDILNAAGIGRFNTLKSAVFATLTDSSTNSWTPSVLSRLKSQLVSNPTTVISTEVTSVLLNKRVTSLRQRKVASVY
jgi:hypothetical protein